MEPDNARFASMLRQMADSVEQRIMQVQSFDMILEHNRTTIRVEATAPRRWTANPPLNGPVLELNTPQPGR